MAFENGFVIETKGRTDILDITPKVERAVSKSGVHSGIVLVFTPGSTAGLTTIEYEPGAISDLKDAIARIAPEGMAYAHDARWGDGNGFSHVRAALLGPSLSLPLQGGRTRHRNLAADSPGRFRQPPEKQAGGSPDYRGCALINPSRTRTRWRVDRK